MEESFAKKYSDFAGSTMLSSFMPNVTVMHNTMYSDVVKNDFIKAKDISKPSGKFSIKLIDVGKNYLGSDITDTPIVFEAAQQLVANHMMQGEDAKADEFSPEQVQNGYNAMFDNVYFQGRKYSVIRNRNNNSAETITRKLLELLPKEEIDSLPKFSGVEGALSLQQLDFGSFAIMKQIHTGKDKGFYTLQDDNGNPIVVNVN